MPMCLCGLHFWRRRNETPSPVSDPRHRRAYYRQDFQNKERRTDAPHAAPVHPAYTPHTYGLGRPDRNAPASALVRPSRHRLSRAACQCPRVVLVPPTAHRKPKALRYASKKWLMWGYVYSKEKAPCLKGGLPVVTRPQAPRLIATAVSDLVAFLRAVRFTGIDTSYCYRLLCDKHQN